MLNLIKDSSRYSAARSCKIWSKRLGVIAENLCERREQSALSLSLSLPLPFSLVRDSKRKRLRMPLTMSGADFIYLRAIGNGENAQAAAWIIDDLAVYRRKGRVRGDRKNI